MPIIVRYLIGIREGADAASPRLGINIGYHAHCQYPSLLVAEFLLYTYTYIYIHMAVKG